MSSNDSSDRAVTADLRNIKWDPKASLFRIRVSQVDPRTGIRSNRKATAVDHRSALEERDRLEQEIATGTLIVTTDPILGEYAKSWLDDKLLRLRSRNTALRYGDEIRLHILGAHANPKVCLGKLKVRAIGQADLNLWFKAMANANANLHVQASRDKKRAEKSAQLVEAGKAPLKELPRMKVKSYSNATINSTWRTLKQILQDAVVGLQLDKDPTMGIDPLPEASRTRAKANVLTAEEVCTLLAYAKEHAPYWHAFMAIGFGIGARLGELKPLRFGDDVDLKAGTILIQQSQRGQHLGETKTRQDRAMAVPSELIDILREHREWLRVNHPGFASGLVFPGYGGWRPWHKDRPLKIAPCFLTKGAFDEPLRNMCAAVGIKRFVSTHVMRRTFVTLCDELEVAASVTRSFTGHKSDEMRLRYTDVSDTRRKEALAKVSNLFVKARMPGGASE